MNRHSRELLQLVRDAEDPTPADEERVLRSLQAAVAAGVTSHLGGPADLGSTSHLGSALERGWLGTARAKLGAFGSKLSVVAACTGAALGTADTPSASAPTLSGGLEPHAARSAEAVASASEPVTGPSASAPSAIPSAPSAIPSVPGGLPAVPGASRPATSLGVVDEAVLAPRATARSASSRPSASSPRRMDTLREELELLQRVQAALKRRDGQAALRELDSSATHGELGAERQVARVLGLCLLGRVAEARRVAQDFAERHPESVQREAIANSCANRERIGDP